MSWKKNFDEIETYCKKCKEKMYLESNRNNDTGIFCCPTCKEHIMIKVGSE